MEHKIEFEVVTPERQVLRAEVDEVVLPSVDGYLGVLPGHAPLLAALGTGEISYRVGKQRHFLAASRGYAEVLRESVSVLAETCEKAEEIDVARARRSLERAEQELKAQRSAQDFTRAEVRLKKALARIQAHERLGG